MDDTRSKFNKIVRHFSNISKSYDSQTMRIILSYFDIVKTELTENQAIIESAKRDIQVHKEQFTLVHDMRCFAHHIFNETLRKVAIEFLSKDSSQYQQCRQAVKDNMSISSLQAVGYDAFNILRVMKLHHGLLKTQQQVRVLLEYLNFS